MNDKSNTSANIQVACIQLCSSTNVEENLNQSGKLIRSAAKHGSRLIITPEMTSLIEKDKKSLLEKTDYEENNPALNYYINIARELSISLIVGSLPIKISETQCVNRCYAICSKGNIKARYDKIHLFDAAPSGRDFYRESDAYCAGNQAVVVTLEEVNVGLSICYDLRFPQLYNDLAKAGAQLFAIPAAFTKTTGNAHWHTLVRARAIENGCFAAAPAQTGKHADGRQTYGHSLIVNPWGETLADGGTEVGVSTAAVNIDVVNQVRNKIPNLQHQKSYLFPINSNT